MENLINDLMDYAKMENNSFTVFNENFDMIETIYEAFHTISHQATLKNIELKALIDHPENLKFLTNFYGDKKRLGQTLANFLSNALKFTNQDGCITLDIKVRDVQDIVQEDDE
jgi:signal transduction histidine kinase